MPLLDRVQKDMVSSMKARDEGRLSTLRMMKTALKKHEVDAMKPLDEAAEMQILKSLVKQRTALAETGVTALKQMGIVMKATQAKLAGKTVDGKALSEKVRSRLQ